MKAVCGQLEVNVVEQMQRSSNELQTLDYRSPHPFSSIIDHQCQQSHINLMSRLSNERKEAELRVKEDASGEPPSEVANNLNNPFVRSNHGDDDAGELISGSNKS